MPRQPKQPGQPNDPQQPKRKKSTYGGGSVYPLKDGRYAASIKDPVSGKRIVRYGKTRKEAEKKLEDIKFEIRQGTLATGPNQTVEQYLTTWLENVQRQVVEEISYLTQKRILKNHVIPAFGHLQLKSLTALHIQQLYTTMLREGYKPKTIQGVHAFLHKALKNAVRWKMVSFNVADQVTVPRKSGGNQEEKEVAQPLTAEQALRLLSVSRGHPLEAFIALALCCALRHGELMALRWQDVDLEARQVSINWTVHHDWERGYIRSDPKTKTSKSTLQLPQLVVDALRRHRERQQEHKIKMGDRWEENDLVFPSRFGKYVRPENRLRQFHRLLEKAGLPRIRIHDLRHSTASLLILVLKMPPKLVQELLRHSTLDMTMNIYTHADASQQRQMMDALDRFLEAGFR